MQKVMCRCETVVEIDVPLAVDIDETPETLSALADGDSPSAICPRCGATVRAELPLRVIGKKHGVDLVILPDMERLSAYRGKIDAPGNSEVLVGYQELFERARILRDDLDPRSVEALKYALQGKAEESEPEADITVLYNGTSGGSLEFHVLGLKSGQTGVVRLPDSMYGKMLATLQNSMQREPYKTLFSGRYRSIRKLGFLASIAGSD
ncbi:MAG: hypothetical protein JXM71_04655 [Spirochaetales bacterium]|nr:hypothetical protein [Spirochaetales bacterium]